MISSAHENWNKSSNPLEAFDPPTPLYYPHTDIWHPPTLKNPPLPSSPLKCRELFRPTGSQG